MQWRTFSSPNMSDIVKFMNTNSIVFGTHFPSIFQDNSGGYTLVYYK
jgi:hypothetical protein